MNSTPLQNMVERNASLFWGVAPEKRSSLSEEAIVEAILNYGDIQSVRELISLLGLRKTAGIFKQKAFAARSNYQPLIRHFFTLYFDRHAPGDTLSSTT